MNTSAKGRRREWASRDLYLAHGWLVTRAAGSHGIDLIATYPETGAVHYLNIKSNRWPPSIEIADLRSIAMRVKPPARIRCVVHRYDDRRGCRVKIVNCVPERDVVHDDPAFAVQVDGLRAVQKNTPQIS